ncbi:hypothetical protein Tco_0899435, partial [Tanacetum coccineum]
TAQEMWLRVKRLMHGTDLSDADRETRLNNEFDKFTTAPVESFVSKILLTSTNERLLAMQTLGVFLVTPTNTPDFAHFQTLRKFKQSCTAGRVIFKQKKEEMLDNDGRFAKKILQYSNKIRSLEKERDDLQLNVSEQRNQLLELKTAHTSLKHKLNATEDKPKPLLVYDPQLKHGLGYENPYTLKKAISQNPKLYDASYIHSSKVHVNVCDTEEILKDATKSQIKIENTLKDPIDIEKKQNFRPIDYGKLNDLYKTFVPQVELSLEQKCFSSASTSSETPTSASTSSSPPLTMPRHKDVTSVRRPSSRSSSSKNSILSNTKNHLEDVEVHVRTNIKTNVTSIKNAVQTKKIVTNVNVQNTLEAKDVSCVSCDKNVLTPCHDKCLAKHKLSMNSKVRRAVFITS